MQLEVYIANARDPVNSTRIEFPTTEKIIEDAFRELRIHKPEDIKIEKITSDIDALDSICELHDVDAVVTINNINYLASLIEDLCDYDIAKFEAAVEYEETGGIINMINIAANIEDYYYYPEITSTEELGEFYIHEVEAIDTDQLGILGNYIDYAAYGRDLCYEGIGSFVSDGWIEHDGWGNGNSFAGEYDDNPYAVIDHECTNFIDDDSDVECVNIFAGYNIENLW